MKKFIRGFKALNKRVSRAINHRDGDEIASALFLYGQNALWLYCTISTIALLGVGFFKPHCFALAGLYLIVSGLLRSSIKDTINA